ncbi:MAG: VCBS repeat-containing protein [Nitrospira sp.]|nr:VCBS repeat-containing protein [Nitrospira sp.]
MSWTGENWGAKELRFVADLTGDGRADIVGFGRDGVWAAVNKGGNVFSQPHMSLTSFNSQGWRVDQHVRLLADLTGDGKADIIGFGDNDVVIALSNGDGTFALDKSVLTEFITSKGWRVDQHPRFAVDVTGDGKADIIGFGNDGVWTALGNGDGTFQAPKLVLAGFNVNQGWRVDQHPRFVVDLTGDGKADIVGFGNDGVWTALGNGDGTFQAPKLVLAGFSVNQGWRVEQHPRFVVDLTGDGKADIVGFGNDGVWTALGNEDGTFGEPRLVLANFGVNQGWRVDQHPRFVVDLTGDGKADIVGFGDNGVWTAVSNGDGTFGEPKFFEEFGVKQGWRVEQHPRFMVDLTGDGKADIIGFGNEAGPRIALSNGDGTFQPAKPALENVDPQSVVKTKVIPLDFLQRKFDLFFKDRSRPLFKVRLHNLGGGDHRHSTIDVLFDDPAKGYTSQLRDGQPKDLGQLEVSLPWAPDPDFHFSDLNSTTLTATAIPGSPVGVEVRVDFEVEGVEMIVNNFPDIDFDGFNIRVGFRLEHDADAGLVSVATDKSLIHTHASVNVSGLPDGVFASGVEGKFNEKIADALKDNRDAFNRIATRWLVGGDFMVLGVAGDDQSLTITYVIPPGQLEPFPEHPQPPLDPGRLANIDHIVVLMMENRSFDHMLGYLSKEGGGDGRKRLDIDGLRGGEVNDDGKGHSYTSFSLPDTTFTESPDHSHLPVENQIDGGQMDGFVKSFIGKYPTIDNPGKIMGYHTAAHVPVYDALAREFLVCQRWFAAHPGPTFCNRFYTLTGRLNRDSFGNFEFDNFTGSEFKPVPTKTIFDHLTDRAVSWHFYEHRYCSLRMYAQYTLDDHYIVDADDPIKGFFASARAGSLPSVSFIDPNFIDEPDGQDNDDGAPANISAGQNLIGRIVDAVVRSPKWAKTMLIVTYDEHGGFYDHVNPLDPQYRVNAKPVSGIDHYGVRVPTLVISPWVDQSAVSDVVFDHTSIAKTIARRFMSATPPDLGERVSAANDLSMVLRPTPRQDIPSIPVPPAPEPRAAFEKRVAPAADSDDFKEVMRALRDRYPIRRDQ